MGRQVLILQDGEPVLYAVATNLPTKAWLPPKCIPTSYGPFLYTSPFCPTTKSCRTLLMDCRSIEKEHQGGYTLCGHFIHLQQQNNGKSHTCLAMPFYMNGKLLTYERKVTLMHTYCGSVCALAKESWAGTARLF